MKKRILLYILFYFPAITLIYTHNKEKLELTFDMSYEDALKPGAMKCMDFYTKGKGASVGEEKWLDLIDVCVNPRRRSN